MTFGKTRGDLKMGNSLGIELEGKHVVLSEKIFNGNTVERVFFCESGFGCSSFTMGTKVYGVVVSTGEECWVRGYHISRLATESEVEEAKKFRSGK